MKIVSVNVGMPRGVVWKGMTVQTAIFKEPVAGSVRISKLNLAGDQQADLTVHGGPEKAVYACPAEHYEYWRKELPEVPFSWGRFGENLTTEGLREGTLCIGDSLKIGSAVLMVTRPRMPCYKLDLRFDRDDMIKRFLMSGRSGFYFSVIEPGEVTGGGSHIVIGGATVLDSPFLRRPDLLRSMLAFWQNHPSLSYLFSGMYVGPTSQSPRVDEARMEALYELEVAFSNLPASDCPPSTVDGLFRNLLVDVTGNSHRAEFCVDKLYPAEGLGLGLGLLELRAFEMAPHVRMGLIEMLLIHALICMFWKRPFDGGLVRWGTALHDRFMLPHFVRHDFSDVLSYLRGSDYKFEEKWFASHFEFRFPKIGSITAEGVELDLRAALEPWNVLAEETTSGRTARTVDSSFERIQVKLSGFTTESRYVVACNGRRVPLHDTGLCGSGAVPRWDGAEPRHHTVAGVRYRARQLSEMLHPTIPVHAPLIFDIIDCWKERSIGRCVYHVGSPDGRAYTARPVNAAEAADRRRQRFQKSDPAPGLIAAPEEETNPIFPMTLDLRLPPPGQKTIIKKSGVVS